MASAHISICIIMMDATPDCKRMHKEFTSVFNKIRKNGTYNVIDHYIRYDEPNIVRFIKINACEAIILSGSEARIIYENTPNLPIGILKTGLPILALCYGYEWIVKKLGGKVATFKDGQKHSYRKYIEFNTPFILSRKPYAFCHHEYISALPKNSEWEEIHKNGDQIWIAQNKKNNWLCLQFHPEASLKSGEAFYTAWIKWFKENSSLKINV
jgi:GMP synthase-like glutamine amidotransferase